VAKPDEGSLSQHDAGFASLGRLAILWIRGSSFVHGIGGVDVFATE